MALTLQAMLQKISVRSQKTVTEIENIQWKIPQAPMEVKEETGANSQDINSMMTMTTMRLKACDQLQSQAHQPSHWK